MKVLYAGTFTESEVHVGQGKACLPGNANGKGVYSFELIFDASEKTFEHREIACTPAGVSPAFIYVTRNQKYLFSVSEINAAEGELRSFRRGSDGKLELIETIGTDGVSPCYLETDKADKYLLQTNYTSGNINAYVLDDSTGKLQRVWGDQWSKANKVIEGRQDASRAHCVVLDNEEKFAYCCNLGGDELRIYEFHPENQSTPLVPHPTKHAIEVEVGTGPRHIAIHPNGKHLFVAGELNSTALAFGIGKDGSLTINQTLSTLPADFKAQNLVADIHLTPDGKFLYVSNRGHDSLAIYSVDAESGRLTSVDFCSIRGQCPRNFMIDPTGVLLLSANQETKDIAPFWIDQSTGKLEFVGKMIPCPTPVCLKMAEF